MIAEPLIHSHITDELPDAHPLAFESVHCAACGYLVHAGNNECMRAWVETGNGNHCLSCWISLIADEDVGDAADVLDPEWGLST